MNIHFFPYAEADWLSWLQSGYCWEIEIKVSRSDFKADFKKEKHDRFKNCMRGKFLGVKKGYVSKRYPKSPSQAYFPELLTIIKRDRYNRELGVRENVVVRYDEESYTSISYVDSKDTPNKFWYIVPENLIEANEVPDYAGLMYIDDKNGITIIKNAPFIHKKKHDVTKSFNKMYYCYEHQVRQSLFPKPLILF